MGRVQIGQLEIVYLWYNSQHYVVIDSVLFQARFRRWAWRWTHTVCLV